MTFGLITEGPTDQIVLHTLLARYIDPNVDIRTVQPNTDSTDKAAHFGGWRLVLNYCQSPDMVAVLEANDYVIIQMDTDVCDDYGVSKRQGELDLTGDEIVAQTKEVIIANIGAELYSKHKEKVIFAISYESIECWLLPLYFTDNSRTKTLNCCEKLNQELIKKGFTIDCNSKAPRYYNKICREIKSRKQVEAMSAHNGSFNQFVAQLPPLQ